jgi:hypothetical protein
MRGLVIVCLALVLIAPAASAQVPRGVIAEDATATWCQYCPAAYAGLEIMKGRYDATEFSAVRYYATSGSLGSAETDARIGYYGISSFPTVVFDGTFRIVGGGAAETSGASYDPIVANEIGRPSPLQIRINSVDLLQPDGSINYDLQVVETIPDISNVKIRTLLLENNVTYGTETMQDVTRDVLPDVALTVSQFGQVQNVSLNFAINPAWKTQDLWIAIFVQNDNDKSILQSGSTRPAPVYSLRYWAKGFRCAVRPSNSAPFEFENFAVFNLGSSPNVIRATVQPGTLPAGWQCAFTDGTNDYTTYLDITLAPGQSRIFRMKVTPGSTGYGMPKIVLTSTNLPGVERTIQYEVITNDVQVLLVDDDGGENYQDYHVDALQNAGYTFGVWSTGMFDVSAGALANFPIVVWEIGLSYPTLTASDRAALGSYLDGGGRLFITGQDLGWEMDDSGGASLAWYHQYLHANFVNDDSNRNLVAGVAGDPISNGMSMSLTGGDGANNNTYPEVIDPLDSFATTIFTYTGTPVMNGALKVETSAYKVVYVGFPYESISTAANRRLLTQRALAWLSTPTGIAEGQPSLTKLNLRAFPNPARGTALLTYDLPNRSQAILEIYAPDGSLARRLVDGNQDAGRHNLTWDGRMESGALAPSGVYFYRLQAGSATPTGKLVLTR